MRSPDIFVLTCLLYICNTSSQSLAIPLHYVLKWGVGGISAEVNISSYPARILAGLFFFCRAEILNSGGFVQKYSDQGVSCKNIGQ